MCLNIGTPNNHHFPFGTNGKVVVLGVQILKHFRVSTLWYIVIYIFGISVERKTPVPTGIIPFSRLGGFNANLGSAEIFFATKERGPHYKW